MSEVLFHHEHGRFTATELSRGPWDPGSCHGGAPAALLAALIDASPSLAPMQVVRLTYDIVRPVPLAPVEASLRVVREGKRVQVVEADLTTPDGTELVRCRALRVRVGQVELPEGTDADAAPPSPGPTEAAGQVERAGEAWGTGFWTAVEVRPTTGSVLGTPGPGTAWFRLGVPIADDVDTTPIARVAAASDFGNGLAPPLPIDRYLYLNADLTVDVHRLPVGDWVALDSRSVAQPSGIGLTTSTLSDERGRIGTALQSLFLAAR
ncbi:thioesterase family protein [Nitriliruptor alkaliphilus]|uniref:thioesterase family protein n=1 Tax=Nitriliruptor alkaliphilus TaxID=427918 RepID=UPI0006973ACF|nr:thioesterase family protein [Nitriliruptor alkaliphilus]